MSFKQVVLRFLLPVTIGCVGLFSLYQNWFISLIPRHGDRLEVLGQIIEIKGENHIKKGNDNLWLPLTRMVEINNGDYLKTDIKGKIVVELYGAKKATGSGNRLDLEGDSYVRLLRNGNKLIINLKTGKVLTQLQTQQDIEIENAIKNTKTEAPKETAEVSLTKDKTLQVKKIISVNQNTERHYQSYPINDSYIFYKKMNAINLVPKEKCQKDCQFLVYINSEKKIEVVVKAGETIKVSLSFPLGTAGKINWQLKDEVETQGQFMLFPMEQKSFQEALSLGKTIEFLD